jgi:hypothetical protein
MNARSLLAAAFAVLGVYYAAIALVRLAMLLITQFRQRPEYVSPAITALVLGMLFLLCRGRMARFLASTPAGEAVPTAAQLQTVGITLLGLWFAASGAIALAGDALAMLLAMGAEQDPSHGRFMQRNAEAVATTLAGIATITIANRIPGWLDRIRRAT